MNVPIVSVVMSVYNGERFLPEAVESILHQTFRDFEFIIINDGSTDGTAEILSGYQKIDCRIIVRQQPNKGLVESLNKGCGLAWGRYIARMDADDIAMPERLERQINYLEQNPQAALLGSSVNIIDDSGRLLCLMRYPVENEKIRKWLFILHQVPFSHPAWVFRAEAFRAAGGYKRAFLAAEDYDLLIRIAERWQVANLPEPLLKMRRHGHSVSITNIRQQVISILGAWAASAIRRAGGRDPIDQEEPVSRDRLRSLGVSDAMFEESLMGVYQYWISVMLQASDHAGALRVMSEALESESWKHINKSVVANTWLEAARLYSDQGRHLESAFSVARALVTRPIIAGRPIKRLVSRLAGHAQESRANGKLTSPLVSERDSSLP